MGGGVNTLLVECSVARPTQTKVPGQAQERLPDGLHELQTERDGRSGNCHAGNSCERACLAVAGGVPVFAEVAAVVGDCVSDAHETLKESFVDARPTPRRGLVHATFEVGDGADQVEGSQLMG